MTGCGYGQAQQITPYIHIMIYHVPIMLENYKTIKIFTGQGKTSHSYNMYMEKVRKQTADNNLLRLIFFSWKTKTIFLILVYYQG